MSLDPRTADGKPARDVEDLVGWFRERERPPASWKVGLEHEKLALRAGTLDPVPYDGEPGIAGILRAFGRFGYQAFEEEGRIIASQREGLTVSIEPGGQLELSGRPLPDVHVVAPELDRHLAKCRAIAGALGVEFLAAGYRPWGTPERPDVRLERGRVVHPAAHGQDGSRSCRAGPFGPHRPHHRCFRKPHAVEGLGEHPIARQPWMA